MSRRGARSGFTLLEVCLVVAIIAMMLLISVYRRWQVYRDALMLVFGFLFGLPFAFLFLGLASLGTGEPPPALTAPSLAYTAEPSLRVAPWWLVGTYLLFSIKVADQWEKVAVLRLSSLRRREPHGPRSGRRVA